MTPSWTPRLTARANNLVGVFPDRAWGEEDLEVSERAADNVILRLPRKLPEPDLIETVRGVGLSAWRRRDAFAVAWPAVTTMLFAGFALVLASCAGTRETVAIVTGAEPPQGGRSAWVVGVARNAKLGAIVIAGDHVVYCDARAEWPADVDGRPVVVAGTLTSRPFPTPTVGLRDERSAGPEGTAWTLAPCAPPPRHDGDGLIEAERSLFAALARRDREQLERLIAPEFVLRIPGQRDVDRAGFLDSISAMPAGILEVTGDRLGAHAAGDTGIVEGVQVARVRIDGKIVEDRGAFVDVFVKRDGAWRLSFALNLSLTDPAR